MIMRTLRIDTDRTDLRSTGVVTPVIMWVDLPDGRRPDPNGRQDVDKLGRPRWIVECIAQADADDERDSTSVVRVEIASHERPEAGQFGALVRFDDLAMAMPYAKKNGGGLSLPMWSASGIRRQGHQQPKPQAA